MYRPPPPLPAASTSSSPFPNDEQPICPSIRPIHPTPAARSSSSIHLHRQLPRIPADNIVPILHHHSDPSQIWPWPELNGHDGSRSGTNERRFDAHHVGHPIQRPPHPPPPDARSSHRSPSPITLQPAPSPTSIPPIMWTTHQPSARASSTVRHINGHDSSIHQIQIWQSIFHLPPTHHAHDPMSQAAHDHHRIEEEESESRLEQGGRQQTAGGPSRPGQGGGFTAGAWARRVKLALIRFLAPLPGIGVDIRQVTWLKEGTFTNSAEVPEMDALNMLNANFDILNRKLDEMNMNATGLVADETDAPAENELFNQSQEAEKEELKTYKLSSVILSEEKAHQDLVKSRGASHNAHLLPG
ncbi:hypothetical protein ACLOJK_024196 [Asimina triloba]